MHDTHSGDDGYTPVMEPFDDGKDVGYFNAEQEAYMEELWSLPREKRCFCGWYLLAECPHCPKDRTNADKCLPCQGVGKRWIELEEGRHDWGSCPDCYGSGLNAR